MSVSNQFDWVDFYKELSGKLLQYKNNRTELVEKVRRIYEITGINLPTLEKDNQIVDIDPFTFFGLFNKKLTDANRLSILKAIASIFDVKAPVPTAFDSIPVLNPQNATFYYFIPDRGEDDIQDLWELFDAALAYSKKPSSETIARVSKYFDLCINRKGNGNSKITMGLYWIAPNDLLNLDQRNTLYIYESGKIPAEIVKTLPAIEAKIPSEKYFEIVEKLRAYLQSDASNIKDFKELSFEAWKYSEQANQEKAAGQKAKAQKDNQGAAMIDREQCRTKKKKRKKIKFFKEVILPLVAIIISIFSLISSQKSTRLSEQANQISQESNTISDESAHSAKQSVEISEKAMKISEQAAQDVRDNNDIVNKFTVNLNRPTFNFRYHYGDSKNIITEVDIENEGTSLSTNNVRLYPYLEVMLRNNRSEEDFIQQKDIRFPSKYLFEKILVPIGDDIFDIEYHNNRTGTLATIHQNSVYEKLIKDIEECDEFLLSGEKIVSMRLKCYIELNYKDLDDEKEDDEEKEIWNTGYVKKCSNSDYYKIPDEDVGVIKLDETGMSDFNYVITTSTGRFLPVSGEILVDAINANRSIKRSGLISLEVRRLDQLQWSKSIEGEPGDIISYRIHLNNTTAETLRNWHLFINCPTELEFINGVTSVVNSNNEDGIYVSDSINTDDGINIGDYSKGGDAYVYFYVRVGEDAEKVDNDMPYKLTAECSAGHVTGTISDSAYVYVVHK